MSSEMNVSTPGPATTRNLIFCSDGTWASPQSRDRGVYAPSNVVKIVKALRHGNIADLRATADASLITEQIVFYDKGVGTGGFLDRLVGGATGEGLEQNVRDGYNFLVNTYQPGNRIFLVGFSRGAYTVRRLAGFICRFGLLNRANYASQDALTAAIKELYQRFMALTATHEKLPLPSEEERLSVGIEAIGVWDTVGALGLPDHPILSMLLGWNGRRDHEFIDHKLSPKVRHAYHALALDEPRAAFEPSPWESDPVREANGTLKQVWFAGAHSNVGGSYQESGLSDITLKWMIDQLKRHQVAFRDDAYLSRVLQPDCYGEVRNPREGWNKLLYWRTLKRVPGKTMPVHQSVRDRGIPASLCQYSFDSSGHSVFELEPGLLTNELPGPATDGKSSAPPAT